MKKKRFKEYSIDERVLIIKQFSKDFSLWYHDIQLILSIQNPVIKIYNDNVCVIDNINELNEFYFVTQSYLHNENRSL